MAEEQRARVFISYSRADEEIAEPLRLRLIEAGFDAYLDKHDIAKGEDWRKRLGDLIAGAEKLIYLISPNSVGSEICDWEVNEAERQGKSVLPVVARETPAEAIPARLSRLNFVFFRSAAERAAGVAGIAEALRLDLGWEREKTRLNDQAEAWDRADRPSRLLLWRQEPLRAAEAWRDRHPPSAPAPTETQLLFISESRRAYGRRQRAIRIALVAIALVTSAAAGLAYWQREEAVAQRDAALITESRMLARAAQRDIAAGNVARAMAVARRALPAAPAYPLLAQPQDRPFVRDALQALYDTAASRREMAALRGHEGEILGAAQLRDGRLLTWSEDGAARLWSPDGAPLAVLRHDRLRGAMALEDDRILTWGGDGAARVWGPDGAMLAALRHGASISGAARLVDQRILTWGADGAARLWSPEGEPIAVLRHDGGIDGATELRDGRILSWGDDLAARLWSPSGEPGPALPHERRVDGAVELSDGRLVTWQDYGIAKLWSPGGEALATLRPRYAVRGVLELNGGRLLTWGSDLQLWSAEGAEIATLRTGSETLGVKRVGGGRILTWDWKGMQLWSASGEPVATTPDGASGALTLKDGRILAWSHDGSLRLLTAQGAEIAVLRQKGETGLGGALLLRDGRFLTWGADRVARLWRLDDPGFVAPTGGFQGLAELGDGRFLTWGDDNAARLWRSDGGADAVLVHKSRVAGAIPLKSGEILTWSLHMRIWSPDGQERDGPPHETAFRGALELRDGRLLTWSLSDAQLWGSDRKTKIAELRHEREFRGALELSDGRILSWGGDKTARIWSADGAPGPVLPAENGVIGAAALDGGRILTWSSIKTAEIWSAEGAKRAVLTHPEGFHGARGLADGRILTWSRDGVARLWSAEGEPLAALEGHRSQIFGAIELGDGRILTWSRDRTARLWRADGAPLAILRHAGEVWGGTALKDGRILTWSRDGTAGLWSPGGEAIAMLRHGDAISGAGEVSGGRILTWSLNGVARFWPGDDQRLIEQTDQAIAALGGLSVQSQCAVFQLGVAICDLVGGDVYRADPVEALLAQGAAWAEARDPRAERAFALAIGLGGAPVEARVATIRAAPTPSSSPSR